MSEKTTFDKLYNPDVLSCLANLSNDEVFTPPDVANAMLDMLPQELFRDPDATFLDPACKSGVFLREIAKRLIEGLADEIPDLQERIDHIFHKQLYGIAITELTSLLSRRSVYCSKYPNGDYSVSKFENAEGNIRYKRVRHTWDKGKCVYCGASEKEYKRSKDLETHAYEWIHVKKPEDIFKMKFDVIISNPPYQLGDGGNGASAKPLYHHFVQQSIKLAPKYLTMIIPARWYAGGKGLDSFRDIMLNQKQIKTIVDIANSADCFPGVNIAGGVCYFLWTKDLAENCEIKNMVRGEVVSSVVRPLNEFDYFVRNNQAISIIRKIRGRESPLSEFVFSRNYFDIPTTIENQSEFGKDKIPVLTSKGDIWVSANNVSDKSGVLNKYKVVVTYAMSGGNKPSSDGNYQVISSLKKLAKGEACSETYLILRAFETEKEADNLIAYAATKFFRFLLLQALTSIHITRDKFCFVPNLNMKYCWTDEVLYQRYDLTQDEIELIESTIKPME